MYKELVQFVVFNNDRDGTRYGLVNCINIKPDMVPWPDWAFNFAIYHREDVMLDGKRYRGDLERIGVYYHPDTHIETLEQVMHNPKATSTLHRNMINNNWSNVIWTRHGNTLGQFDPDKMTILGKETLDPSIKAGLVVKEA